MRQIKFRGKRIDTGEWITGDLQVGDDDHIPMIGIIDGGRTPIYYQVQESTIGQFIGLDDRNAIHIYEGDIIEDEIGVVYEICWYDDLASFMAEIMCNARPFMISDIGTKNINIIGNIHDNPELLPNQPTAI